MKFDRNLKVEYKSQKLTIPSENRYLLYRIVPSELPLWKRWFCNEWRYAYNDIYYSLNSVKNIDDLFKYLFSYEEAVEFINTYKTYGELADFLNSLYKKAKERYNEINPKDKWKF